MKEGSRSRDGSDILFLFSLKRKRYSGQPGPKGLPKLKYGYPMNVDIQMSTTIPQSGLFIEKTMATPKEFFFRIAIVFYQYVIPNGIV